jgi:uncharacterized protein (DUF433 family)
MPTGTNVVHTDPDSLGGTPVFVGTHVPAQTLFHYLEGGETLDELLRRWIWSASPKCMTAGVT